MRKKLIYIISVIVFILLLTKVIQVEKEEKENKLWKRKGFTGQTIDGMKEGAWIDYYVNDQLAEIKTNKKGVLNGLNIGFTPHGDTGIYYNYYNGNKVGVCKLFVEGYLNILENWDSTGLKQGEFRVYSYGKISQTGSYLDNRFHGEFRTYYISSGQIKELSQYDNGEKVGTWYYFNESGDTVRTEDY